MWLPEQDVSPEHWRWETSLRLAGHDKKLEELHACMEKHAEAIISKLEIIQKRIEPLETMKSMIIGGFAVLMAIGIPMLWYIFSKIIPAIEKMKT